MKDNSIWQAVRKGGRHSRAGSRSSRPRRVPWIIEASRSDYCIIHREHGGFDLEMPLISPGGSTTDVLAVVPTHNSLTYLIRHPRSEIMAIQVSEVDKVEKARAMSTRQNIRRLAIAASRDR